MKIGRKYIEDEYGVLYSEDGAVLLGYNRKVFRCAEYRIKDAGGKVESSVTGKTDILLAGYYCGSNKLAKAREKKIPIFREDKFKKYIKESPVSRTLKDIVR